MTVNLTEECEETLLSAFDFDLAECASLVLDAFAEELSLPYEATVELTVTDDETIREVNEKERGIGRSTDVLSFPVVEYPAPGDFSVLEELSSEAFDPDSGELLLGDIMISAEHVTAQAEAYGHSVKREFAFLITHSLLHLTGYDHMTDEEAAEMERMQHCILKRCGISRED